MADSSPTRTAPTTPTTADRLRSLVAPDEADPLLVVALATFEVGSLVLVAVLIGHATDALADLLGGLGTVSGLVAFAYLWLLSLAATRWVAAAGGLRSLARGRLRMPLLRGTVGGSFVGAGQLLGVAVALGVVGLLGGAGVPQPLSIALILLIGTAVSLVVGAVIGLLFALVAVTLVRVGLRLAPESAGA